MFLNIVVMIYTGGGFNAYSGCDHDGVGFKLCVVLGVVMIVVVSVGVGMMIAVVIMMVVVVVMIMVMVVLVTNYVLYCGSHEMIGSLLQACFFTLSLLPEKSFSS